MAAATLQKTRLQSWKSTELLKGKATLPSPPQLQRGPALLRLEEVSLYLDQRGHQRASVRGERTLSWEIGTFRTFRLEGAKDTRSREIYIYAESKLLYGFAFSSRNETKKES